MDDDCDRIIVPHIECDVSNDVKRELSSLVSPVSHSGIDFYCSALDYINTCI